jgi:hypothetical protein
MSLESYLNHKNHGNHGSPVILVNHWKWESQKLVVKQPHGSTVMAIMESLEDIKVSMDSRKSCESYKFHASHSTGKKSKDTTGIPFRDSNEKARNPNRKQAWQGRWPRAPLD